VGVSAKYDAWHAQRSAYEQSHSDRLFAWLKTVLRLLPPIDGKAVLEIGCGRGDFSICLAQKHPSARITGVDFSQVAIDIARSRCNPQLANLQFETGDAESLPFSPETFDVVISCECLEHVLRPGQMAAEISRVLRPRGQFILTTENYFNGMVVAWLYCWATKTPPQSADQVHAPHRKRQRIRRLRRCHRPARRRTIGH